MAVANKLDVADFEDHVQPNPLAGILQDLDGLLLLWRERRDNTSVGESCQAAHEVRIPLAVHALLTVRVVWVRGFEVEDSSADVGILVNVCGNLALAVKVPDWLGEQLSNVRSLCLEDVPDVVDRSNVTLATGLSSGDAEEADNVTGVCVEELASIGSVDAHFVDGSAVLPKILYVPQNVAC